MKQYLWHVLHCPWQLLWLFVGIRLNSSALADSVAS
jgi:hypothetical protein